MSISVYFFDISVAELLTSFGIKLEFIQSKGHLAHRSFWADVMNVLATSQALT